MKAEITHHAGKGSRSEILPSRSALSTLTRDPMQRPSINDYAKATPDVVQNGPNVEGKKP